MYILKFDNNTHIHEVKTHKTNPKMEYKLEMYESSKLDYTSTSNGFNKRSSSYIFRFICGPLYVQV